MPHRVGPEAYEYHPLPFVHGVQHARPGLLLKIPDLSLSNPVLEVGVAATIRQALPLGIAVRNEGIVRESPVVRMVVKYLHPALFSSSLECVFRLHGLFARDATLEVYEGVSGILIHKDRGVVILLLCEFALELGDKTWSVGLQLVY